MKMSVILSLLFPLFLLIHTSNAFDITQILNNYPDFSTFNSYLTQTNLATAINGRQTITVLVVDNANLSPISSYPPEVIKNILSVHVILDYYDPAKLQQLASGLSLLTTLFQASGLAKGQQGFLNVTHAASSVTFSSAMPGSTTQGSSLVKSVLSQPYNISILQISTAIIPQGIDGTKTSSPPSVTPPPAPATVTPPPPPAPTTATATAPTQSSTAPPPTPATAAAPPQTSMSPPPTTSKGMAPSSSPPTMSQAPSAAPRSVTEPGTLAPESPARDEPAAAGDKTTFKSGATAIEIGLALVCTMALSTLHLGSRI